MKNPTESQIDLTEALENRHFITCSLDYSGRVLVLTAREDISNYYTRSSYSSNLAQKSIDYEIFEATEQYTASYLIKNQRKRYYKVQPLPEGKLLLAFARFGMSDVSDDDTNAIVFDYEGNPKRRLVLGIEINHMQATRNGTIWTSYFGGNDYRGPEIHQWDVEGNELYSFDSIFILDCYAMNVTSDTEVWIHSFPSDTLAKVSNNRTVEIWDQPLKGIKNIAIWRDYVVFCGCYDDEILRLYQLNDDHTVTHLRDFDWLEDHEKAIARGDRIVVKNGYIFYQFTVSDLVKLV